MGRLAGVLDCVGCGRVLDGYTMWPGGREAPSDGDFSVCAYCSTVQCFVGHPLLGWTFRAATGPEIVQCAQAMAEQRPSP